MNKDELIKWKILNSLYEVWRVSGPHNGVMIDDIAQGPGISRSNIQLYVTQLKFLGLVRGITMQHIGITDIGVACIDKDSHFTTHLKNGDKNISINAPVTGSTIVQGNNNVVSALNFIAKLEDEIENSGLPEEEKKTWLGHIKEISFHPLLVEALSKVLDAAGR